MEDSRNVWILVTRSESLPGQWVAHCLDLDVMSQGNSLEHAFEMIREAVYLCMHADLEAGLDPFERAEAPAECWVPFWDLMKHGVPMNKIPPEKRSTISAVAAQVQLSYRTREIEQETAPALWQLAALDKLRGSSGSHPC